jgi:hypothetical protein
VNLAERTPADCAESLWNCICRCSTRIMSVPNCGILRAIVASKIPKEVVAKRFRPCGMAARVSKYPNQTKDPVHLDRDYRLTRSRVHDTIHSGAMPNY